MMNFLLKTTAVLTVFSVLSITIVQSNDQCDCGLLNVQSRISHGNDANPHKYPWVAFIKIFKNGTYSQCTGSLIDDQTILTAAHCVENNDGSFVEPSQLLVFLGITTKKDAFNDVGRSVEAILPHPGRNKALFENDIALLRLEEPVKMVKIIRPVCLPMTRGESVYGKMKVAGFGLLRVEKEAFDLQEADIDFVERNTCQKKLSDHYSRKGESFSPLSETSLCGQGKDTAMICQGDSGGPLMHANREGRMVVAGVSQYIYKKCGDDANIPDMYANVGLFTDFIKEYAPRACFVELS
ncbi:granzyme H-like [Brevipalpus obovatus]|uniref:granzyme H-like n=1 Tax=Brevipalpus obovatus TaxID=246614 RepID=UPI003D9F26CB